MDAVLTEVSRPSAVTDGAQPSAEALGTMVNALSKAPPAEG
jgi:hypothetical protein